jgi:hypothetical protein
VPNQTWLVNGPIRLLTVQHFPRGGFPIGGAVLFAGFSQPMCDLDYFMSRLARQLTNHGFFVAQVDPRGHGDSCGRLEDVDLSTLREDINFVAQRFAALFPDLLLVVGRGLSATLIAEQLGGRPQFALAGISPYALPPNVISSCHYPGIEDGTTVDARVLFPGDDYVRLADFPSGCIAVIDALGTVPYNLHGAGISRSLISQLADFDAAASLRNGGNSNAFIPEQPFVRDPASQMKLISQLARWAMDRAMTA